LNFKCSALLSHVVETGTGCRRRRLADKSMGSKLSVVGSGQNRRTTVKRLAGPRFIGICERCLSHDTLVPISGTARYLYRY
jgi:hypothetical protein